MSYCFLGIQLTFGSETPAAGLLLSSFITMAVSKARWRTPNISLTYLELKPFPPSSFARVSVLMKDCTWRGDSFCNLIWPKAGMMYSCAFFLYQGDRRPRQNETHTVIIQDPAGHPGDDHKGRAARKRKRRRRVIFQKNTSLLIPMRNSRLVFLFDYIKGITTSPRCAR